MRREVKVVIPATDPNNRDKGKAFFITEMDADRGERWAMRAVLAIARSGVDLPDEIENASFGMIAALGIRAFAGISFEEAEPLLAEMFGCIECMPDPANPLVKRPLVPTDTEEISTRLRLRAAVLELHTGFSMTDALSKRTSKLTKPRAGAKVDS